MYSLLSLGRQFWDTLYTIFKNKISIFRNKCKQKGQASGEGSSSAGNAEINQVISIVGR
jgi:hypothetical protein